MTNDFYWKVQQRKLSTHFHRSARGKWEAVEGVGVRGRLLVVVVSVNRASLRLDIWGSSRKPGREGAATEKVKSHIVPIHATPSTTTSIHPTQMLSKRVVSITRGRTALTSQAFSKGL